MDDDKVIEALGGLTKAIQSDNSVSLRLNGIDARILELEKKAEAYSVFISKTSGFFTRMGFYLDGTILCLKGFFKK